MHTCNDKQYYTCIVLCFLLTHTHAGQYNLAESIHSFQFVWKQLYTCMYVCMHVFMRFSDTYIHTHTYINTYTHTHIRTYAGQHT